MKAVRASQQAAAVAICAPPWERWLHSSVPLPSMWASPSLTLLTRRQHTATRKASKDLDPLRNKAIKIVRQYAVEAGIFKVLLRHSVGATEVESQQRGRPRGGLLTSSIDPFLFPSVRKSLAACGVGGHGETGKNSTRICLRGFARSPAGMSDAAGCGLPLLRSGQGASFSALPGAVFTILARV